jgi:hypothetical protein
METPKRTIKYNPINRIAITLPIALHILFVFAAIVQLKNNFSKKEPKISLGAFPLSSSIDALGIAI